MSKTKELISHEQGMGRYINEMPSWSSLPGPPVPWQQHDAEDVRIELDWQAETLRGRGDQR